MSTTPTTHPRTPTLPRRAPRTPPKAEPLAGLWGDRLACLLAGVLLTAIMPAILAVGLGWLSWEQAAALTPVLRRLAAAVWALSLIGLFLSVVALSRFGPKQRTLRGLVLHFLFVFGPLVAAMLMR